MAQKIKKPRLSPEKPGLFSRLFQFFLQEGQQLLQKEGYQLLQHHGELLPGEHLLGHGAVQKVVYHKEKGAKPDGFTLEVFLLPFYL